MAGGLLLAAAIGASVDPAIAKSSIGIGTADVATAPSGGFLGGLFVEIGIRQRAFFTALRQALIGLKRGEGALTFLIGLSFLYGIFHAAGPGHGKAVIASYMLASRAELKRGVALAFASSLVQAMTALLVVGAGWYLLRGTALSMTDATDWLEIVSYLLVTGFGLLLLFKVGWKLQRHYRPVAKLRSSLSRGPVRRTGAGGAVRALAFAAPGELRANAMPAAEALAPGDVCGSGGAEVCDCGHSHIAQPDTLHGKMTLKSAITAVFAVGLRPCAGAVVVLTFALLNELYLGGLVSVFAMALGTAITVSALATLAVVGRGAIERAGRHAQRAVLVGYLIELTGASVMTLLGIGLLGGALAAL
ncbi:nickel/cobalt transporter [Jiella flava]|uniref:Nickel/cobalt efflux system n=1 Tax=Jiella flava TaxID=2816857 RepID=A0A939FW43_9HYPH|nr:nickel/cobalt transporter [Jiella flava]MBO0663053.1 nickel/cobalt transporter [Jiella flava]